VDLTTEENGVLVDLDAAEVKKRLDTIDMVGRSITMKIMKRDPAAPAEPAKVRFSQPSYIPSNLTNVRFAVPRTWSL
jgi:hypothetical protein